MRNVLLLTLLSACSFSDDSVDTMSDAAVLVMPDAAVGECEPSLPTCASLGCAVGALPVDCPRAEDTSVCYCDAPAANPGWCRNE